MEQHQREQRERKEEVLSDESIAAMEETIAAAGWASLDTALTVGTVVPVAGTVIAGGTAFHQQYNKTRDTLLKNGISPAEAHRRALLQALVVGGVAVGADIATGSVLGKLKTVAKFKAFDKSKIDFIEPRLSIRTRDDGEVGCETVSLLARSPWLFHGRRTSGKNGRKPAASATVGAKRRLMDNLG